MGRGSGTETPAVAKLRNERAGLQQTTVLELRLDEEGLDDEQALLEACSGAGIVANPVIDGDQLPVEATVLVPSEEVEALVAKLAAVEQQVEVVGSKPGPSFRIGKLNARETKLGKVDLIDPGT